MMISYAQNFEDVTLWRALKDVSGGHYVDVGAFHPEIDSVTKWFYDQGWSGINLEPVPEMFAVLEAARPRDTNIRAAAGAVAGVATMAVVPDSMGLSSLDVPGVEARVAMPLTLVEVEVRPLREVLEPYSGKDIHFLKIDAEGSEHDVLIGMDFTRFRPWVVVVEATAPLSQMKTPEMWEDILLGGNYHPIYFDGLNEFYVSAEKMDIARKLAIPPNVFDKFELAATVRERQAREELQCSHNSTREELVRTSQQLADSNAALAASHAELAATRDDLTELEHKLKVADNEVTALREQLHASELAIAGLSEELSELAQALRKGRETEGTYQMQLNQVLNSRSFRWLAPARRIRSLLLPHRQ